MNKRQWKKKQGKYLPLFPDEYNLAAMTDAERKQALDDFMAYREKYAFRKRYKDLKNDSKSENSLFYSYPVGATYAAIMQTMRDARLPRKNVELIIVVQTLADFETFYGTGEKKTEEETR